MSLDNLLLEYAVESGEIEDPALADEPVQAEDVAIQEVVEAGSDKLPDEVEHAEKAHEIAEQLDELADRAEELAGEDKQYLDAVASTESLHREYRAIMRANRLDLPAVSFESAINDKARLLGLAADARRYATLNRNYRDAAMDFSAEGKFMRWLMNDKSHLEYANKALDNAERAINQVSGDLKDNPVVVKHKGAASFLTQGGVPIDNLGQAIEREAHWLSKAQHYVEATQRELFEALNKLAHGDASAALRAVEGKGLPSGKGLTTDKTDLMGSAMIVAGDEGEGGYTVPKFTRRITDVTTGGGSLLGSAARVVGTSLAAGATAFLLGGIASGLGASLALGSIPAGFSAIAVGGLNNPAMQRHVLSGAIAAGFGAARGMAKEAGRPTNEDKIKSIAGVSDIHKAIKLVQGYAKYTNFHFDDNAIEKAVNAAKANLASLEGDEKKHGKALISDIEKAFGRLLTLIDCMYDQATYTTTMSAHILERVAKAARRPAR